MRQGRESLREPLGARAGRERAKEPEELFAVAVRRYRVAVRLHALTMERHRFGQARPERVLGAGAPRYEQPSGGGAGESLGRERLGADEALELRRSRTEDARVSDDGATGLGQRGTADADRDRHPRPHTEHVVVDATVAGDERAAAEVDDLERVEPPNQRPTHRAMHGPVQERGVRHEADRAARRCAPDHLCGPANEPNVVVRENADLPLLEPRSGRVSTKVFEDRRRRGRLPVRGPASPGRIADDDDHLVRATGDLAAERREARERVARAQLERPTARERGARELSARRRHRVGVDVDAENAPRRTPLHAAATERERAREEHAGTAGGIDQRHAPIRDASAEPEHRAQPSIDPLDDEPGELDGRVNDAAGAPAVRLGGDRPSALASPRLDRALDGGPRHRRTA